jgi:hypothetical protein
MKRRTGKFNQKRRLAPLDDWTHQRREELRKKVQYGGNPEHKRKPNDFGLTPPNGARRGKSLCDSVGVFSRREALYLLRSGVKYGLISEQMQNGWPKNIWSVYNGRVLEAQLEQQETGAYHGYPLPDGDPFAECVLERWRKMI